MALSALVEALKTPREAMTCDAGIPGPQDVTAVKVLTEVGRSVLHGVLTCILSAHRAGLSFNGACGMGNLRVHVYEGETELVVSRVYVNAGDGQVLVRLVGKTQKEDYVALRKAIHDVLFPGNDLKTLHVGSIYKLLGGFTRDIPDSEAKDIIDPVRRTHLLQAYAATVSSPVAVSTMCLNLKRLYKQLDGNHKTKFTEAMRDAQRITWLLPEVGKQPLFEKVYYYESPSQNNHNSGNVSGSIPNSQYAGDKTGMEMFNFARNWFAHVPNQRWVRNYELHPSHLM